VKSDIQVLQECFRHSAHHRVSIAQP
jgi:hypothetical protein